MSKLPSISCHVLDTARGIPADNVGVRLDKAQVGKEYFVGNSSTISDWELIATGTTNSDGRCPNLIATGTKLEVGTYKMTFFCSDYFARDGTECFFPYAEV